VRPQHDDVARAFAGDAKDLAMSAADREHRLDSGVARAPLGHQML
jgi:hypothetical protein